MAMFAGRLVMTGTSERLKYFRALGVVIAAYFACAIAWWWSHNSRLVVSREIQAWLDQVALVLIAPGLVILWMVKGEGLERNLTDILIPIFGGIFWGLLALLILKSSIAFVKYVHPPDKSR